MTDVDQDRSPGPPARGHSSILEAVAFSAERFLRPGPLDDAVRDVLGHLGRATGVSRVYVFENRFDEDGVLRQSCRFEWCAPDVAPQLDNPELQDESMEEAGFGDWARVLAGGGTLCYHTREVAQPARSILEQQQILSIAMVPVFVDGQWWGSMGFDECTREREWTEGELQALRAVGGILGAAMARERAERELTTTEARYRALVEQMPAITYIAEFGDDGSWLYVSPQMERILGYTPEEWLAHPHPFGSFCHPEDVERVREEEARAREAGDHIRLEYRLRAGDGRWAWILDECTIVRDERGEPLFMQGMMYDSTEIKRAEEERRRLRARLVAAQEEERRLIAGRIHQDQIQKMAAVGLRMRTLAKHVGTEGAEELERLQLTVQRAIESLRQLLFELRPRVLDHEGLTPALAEYLAHVTRTSGVEHRLEGSLTPEPPPETRAAAYRIAFEAVSSARKHARASLITVTLSTEDDGVRMRISDDGVGFDLEARGSSLGLSAMRERAELAGGRLTITSAPGRGTVVDAWLPASGVGRASGAPPGLVARTG